MRVACVVEQTLPPLAYVGVLDPSGLSVKHGSMVETTDQFISDGVWSDSFAAGPSADSFICGTAAVFGRGSVTLVTPDYPVDRVFVVQLDDRKTVFSNSLPVIMAAVDDELDVSHTAYRSAFLAADLGPRLAPHSLRTARGRRLRIIMGETATVGPGWVTSRFRSAEQPFRSFGDYRERLVRTVRSLLTNATDAARQHRFRPLPSVSAGYDSSAVAVVAAEAGVNRALTMLRYDADGDLIDYPGAVAAAVDLELVGVERDTWRERTDLPEAAIAAAGVTLVDVAMLALEPHLTGALLMTGTGGDAVWSASNFRTYPEVVRGTGNLDLRSLGEHRLRVGYVLLPVPSIGRTAHPSIQMITHSQEMRPWWIGGTYDRPIPRRIVEEAGVPRNAFATRKFAGSARVGSSITRYVGRTREERMKELLESMSPAAATSFLDFLESVGIDNHDSRGRRIRTRLAADRVAHLLYEKTEAVDYRVGRRFHSRGIQGLPRRPLAAMAARAKGSPDYTYLLPHWGVDVLKRPMAETVRGLGLED
jgi:hypothetical protein